MKKPISIFLLIILILSTVLTPSFADEPRNATTSCIMQELDSRGIAYTVSQAENAPNIDQLVFSLGGASLPEITHTCQVGSGILKCTVEGFARISVDKKADCLIKLNGMNLNYDATRFYTTEADNGDYLVNASYTAVINDDESTRKALTFILIFMDGNVEGAYNDLLDMIIPENTQEEPGAAPAEDAAVAPEEAAAVTPEEPAAAPEETASLDDKLTQGRARADAGDLPLLTGPYSGPNAICHFDEEEYVLHEDFLLEMDVYNEYFNNLSTRMYYVFEGTGMKADAKELLLDVMSAMQTLNKCASDTELTGDEKRFLHAQISHFCDLMQLIR